MRLRNKRRHASRHRLVPCSAVRVAARVALFAAALSAAGRFDSVLT
jgi:hypothetical protein